MEPIHWLIVFVVLCVLISLMAREKGLPAIRLFGAMVVPPVPLMLIVSYAFGSNMGPKPFAMWFAAFLCPALGFIWVKTTPSARKALPSTDGYGSPTTTASANEAPGVQKAPSRRLIWYGTLLIALVLIYTQLTIFVVQPIGALPEGRTIIMTRVGSGEFIDSPDAMCERIEGRVSLLCRGMIMAAIINNTTIIARLPYSSTLYSISTGGKSYDR